VEFELAQLRDDGTIDVRLGPDWPIFNEALADAVSSLPHRGSEEAHLSTYWFDRTLEQLDAHESQHSAGRVARGNAYSLVFDGNGIEAVFDYGDPNEDVELMSTADFREILTSWRRAVIAAQARESRTVPETYRRNP
jgi:hypothetical protein